MKALISLIVLVTASRIAVAASAPNNPSELDAVVPIVTTKMNEYLTALNARDADRVVSYYLNDPVFRGYFDGQEIGYADLVAAVRGILTQLRRLEGGAEGLLVTPLARDAAVASFRFKRADTDLSGKVTRYRGTATWVWVKRDEEWKMIHGHAIHLPDPSP